MRNVFGHFKTTRCLWAFFFTFCVVKARQDLQAPRSPTIFRKTLTQDHLFFTIAQRHDWPVLRHLAAVRYWPEHFSTPLLRHVSKKEALYFLQAQRLCCAASKSSRRRMRHIPTGPFPHCHFLNHHLTICTACMHPHIPDIQPNI